MGDLKHTPGPWVIFPARPYDGDDPDLEGSFEAFAGIEGGNGDPVCVFGDASGSATMFENAADYALIAAAPELLAHLKFAVKLLSAFPAMSGMAQVEAMRAAIAKAEVQ